MVRCRIVLFLLFVSTLGYSQTFPRFRLIQLQQSDTVGQVIMSDTNNNAYWSSDLRMQDSVFYIFGNPYTVDSTRLNTAGDSVIYYSQGIQIGGDVLPTGLIDSTRLDLDTLKYYQNGVVIGYDLIVTTIDSTRLNDTKDTLLYYQNGTVVSYDLIDGDNTNEIQSITQFNITNDSLYIALSEDGTYGVNLTPYLDNSDTSGFNREFYITDDTLYIVDDLSTKFVSLKPYLNTDEQTLSLINDSLFISNGNGITLAPYLDNTDEQTLTLSNDTLYISNGNSVYIEDTDTSGYNRTFTLINDTLSITDDSSTLSVVLSPNTDTSGYNRQFYITNDSLFITDDLNTYSVDLSAYLDNTDTSGYNTAFEVINDTLYIEDENNRYNISLTKYLDNTDTSGYNTDFSISGDTISITDDFSTKTIILPNTNTDTSGYNQSFTLQDSVLYLQDDDTTITLDIRQAFDNTDTSGYNKTLTLQSNTLYLTDGQSTVSADLSTFVNTDTSGFNTSFYILANGLYLQDELNTYGVDLTPYLDNTDTSGLLKAFYILNDSIYISDGNVNARADLSPYIDNTDTSGYNISLDLINGFLILKDGTTTLQEDLNIFFDNTDTSGYNQQFYVSGSRIYLEDAQGQLYVRNVDYDNQTITLSNDTLYIDRGNYVVLPLNVINTDNQVISISNDTIFLEDGGFIILPNYNTDTSGYNKSFYLNDSILYILDDNSLLQVDLSSAFDNTDNQQLTKIQDTIFLENGSNVILQDDDPTNEIQVLSISEEIKSYANEWQDSVPYYEYTIRLTNGDSVVFSDRYIDGDYDSLNELQELSKANDSIYLSINGGAVALLDDDPTNELQILSSTRELDSIVNHLGLTTQAYKYTVRLTNGDSVIIYDTYNDADISSANELQDLELNGNILRLTLSNETVDLTPYLDDEQQLSKSGDTIYLERGGNVKLLDDDPNNEIQTLSVINDTLYLTNGGSAPLPLGDLDSTRLNERGDSLIYYFNDSIVRKDPISTLIDVVDNCVPPLPNDVDIYALFDMSGSVNINNVLDVISVLDQWYTNYQAAYPNYTGKLYTIPVANAAITEEYLNYLPRLRNNTLPLETSYPTINDVVTLPPWFEGGTFVAPDNILMLAFVNESEPYYHTGNTTFTNEPTLTYKTHLNAFIQEYQSMEYFTGVLYPLAAIPSFLLHAMASAESRVLTDAEIQEYLENNYSAGTYDSLTLSNPYDTLTPLKQIGWSHILNKSASSTFTIESFNTEINEVLASGDKFYVSVIEDYSNNILTLRSIGSQTLDITVDSTGCISIEYLKGDIGVYADSVTILGDGSMESPLFVDTNLIVTTKALNDSLANIPTFVDSTRLSTDGIRLEYYQNGTLIGVDTLTKGDGLFQERWIGNGINNVLTITEQNGLLPNDKNDILLYRNGIYLTSEFITQLDGNSLELSFTPEVNDIITIVWVISDIYTEITAGLDSVFTTKYLLGNGTLSNPLTIDTIYTASKSYVDAQIAASGTGTITGVNENDEPGLNYGLDGGASVGKVNLKVDSSVIAAKQWVINQDYSLIDSVIGGYGLSGGGEQDNVTLTVDTSVIVAKEYLDNIGYITENESITFSGDVVEIDGTNAFDLEVTQADNIEGGTTGNILYQESANNTTFLSLPNNQTAVSEYVLMDGLSAPYWEDKNNITVGSALKLDTARTINNTSFDGSSNIVTNIWGTARDVTIGDTTISINGSTNYSVSLSSIGAIDNTHTFYIGTTEIDIDRTSAGQTLNGVSIDGQAGSVDSSLVAGTYITGNNYNGSEQITFDVDTLQIATRDWVTNNYEVGNQNITLTGDITGSGTTNVDLNTTLANSGVVAGTYNDNSTQVRPFTVDAKGRITAIGTAVTITPSFSNITNTPTTLLGYGITNALSNSTSSTQDGYFSNIYLKDDSTPSHYLSITSNENLTSNVTLSLGLNNGNRTLTLNGNLTVVQGGATVTGTNTGDQTIELTGDITGSGTGSFETTLATIDGLTASTYSYPTLTVDSKGRITDISSNEVNVDADSLNTPLEIVQRNSTGGFSSGSIGIFTDTPLAPLHIAGDAESIDNLSVSQLNTATNGYGRYMFYNTSSPNSKVVFGAGWQDATRFAIFTKNQSGDFTTSNERFTVINTGLVGINNTVPTYRLDVKETNASNIQTIGDGSVRKVASFLGTNDIGLQIGNNYIYNTHQYADDSTAANISIAFATNTATNPTTKMVILGNGNVGIDTLAPQYKLDVNGDIHTAGNFIESSSIRYKKDIKPITNVDGINLLEPVSYKLKSNGNNEIGFIAEEVYKIFPNLVVLNKEGQPDAIKYVKFIPLLVKKIQEQEERLLKLEKLVEEIINK